ncbi:11205_t:CDS:2, partial [Acaulospora morrowiae]
CQGHVKSSTSLCCIIGKEFGQIYGERRRGFGGVLLGNAGLYKVV